MKIKALDRRAAGAFTLTELIVVAGIIVIIIALIPGITISWGGREVRTRGKTDLINAIFAIRQYHVEYGKYPGVPANSPTSDVIFGDSSDYGSTTVAPPVISNERLFNVLRNYPGMERPAQDENPKQIVFFEGTTAMKYGSGNPRRGFATPGSGGAVGAFCDPWGHQYGIMIDGDQDGLLRVPYKDIPAGVKADCAGWSLGKDGQIGNKGDARLGNSRWSRSDDIVTWQ